MLLNKNELRDLSKRVKGHDDGNAALFYNSTNSSQQLARFLHVTSAARSASSADGGSPGASKTIRVWHVPSSQIGNECVRCISPTSVREDGIHFISQEKYSHEDGDFHQEFCLNERLILACP